PLKSLVVLTFFASTTVVTGAALADVTTPAPRAPTAGPASAQYRRAARYASSAADHRVTAEQRSARANTLAASAGDKSGFGGFVDHLRARWAARGAGEETGAAERNEARGIEAATKGFRLANNGPGAQAYAPRAFVAETTSARFSDVIGRDETKE